VTYSSMAADLHSRFEHTYEQDTERLNRRVTKFQK
jgi:hypothetical protein